MATDHPGPPLARRIFKFARPKMRSIIPALRELKLLLGPRWGPSRLDEGCFGDEGQLTNSTAGGSLPFNGGAAGFPPAALEGGLTSKQHQATPRGRASA
jgi:hypothetical protein